MSISSLRDTPWKRCQSRSFTLRIHPELDLADSAAALADAIEAELSQLIAQLRLAVAPESNCCMDLVPADTAGTEVLVADDAMVCVIAIPAGQKCQVTVRDAALTYLVAKVARRPCRPHAGLMAVLRNVAAVDGTKGDLPSVHRQVAEARERGAELTVQADLEAPERAAMDEQAITSFVAFLIERHGAEKALHLAASGPGGSVDEAVEAIYGKPLAVVEYEWLTYLDQSLPRPSPSRTFLRLTWNHMRTHWALVLGLQCTVLATALDPAIRPYLFRTVIDDAIVAGQVDVLVPVALGVAGLFFFHAAATVCRSYLSGHLSRRLTEKVAPEIFDRIQRAPLGTVRSVDSDHVPRLMQELEAVDKGVLALLVEGPTALVTGLFCLAIMTVVEWRLTAVGMAALVLVFVVPRLVEGAYLRVRREWRTAYLDALRTAMEEFRANTIIRAFGLESDAFRRYQADLRVAMDRFMRHRVLEGLLGTATERSGTLVRIIVLATGAYLAFSDSLSIGTLYMFMTQFRRVIRFSQELTALGAPIRAGARSAVLVGRAQEVRSAFVETSDPVLLEDRPQPIGCEQVTFSYSGETANLKRVSVQIPAGSVVAVVGASGSGKSTFLQLLARFFDPLTGRVTIGGHDLRQVSIESFRAHTSFVPQDSFMFNTTVGDNLTRSRPEASLEEIEAAIRTVGLSDFIASLPQGYETPVREGGSRFSQGQRQRLAIARALIHGGRLMILDEATSALDPHSHAEITASLLARRGRQTIIHTTHRMASAAYADLILVLHQGEVIEQGTHEELMARGGEYARLVEQEQAPLIPAGRGAIEREALQTIPLFQGLDQDVLDLVAGRLMIESFHAGETIIRQGDPGDKLYILAGGVVDVEREAEGRTVRVATLQPGAYFGEMALIADAARMASVVAQTDVRTYSLKQGDFNRLLYLAPHLRETIERVIAERTEANAAM